MVSLTRPLAVAAIAAALALSACGSSGSTSAASSSGANVTAVKPTVTIPSTPPPTKLETTDLVEGTGPAAAAGQKVTMQYVGDSWSTKQEFDASWDRGQPFTFTLGAGEVIEGWDHGIVGMKVGGRRQLVIPPGLGYGANSPTPKIKANDTLVFVVDLEKIG
jgi:peptidylprolyl isomerase